jgi:N-methylhydantoinase A/acetone carboxylase, beta subunit
VKEREVFLDDGWSKVPIYRREELREGFTLKGPAIIQEYSSTTLVRKGWNCKVHGTGSLVMEK